ncbi:MAG: sensor domain-containing diguanylate cyclase [Candidatus Omnitrophica bacterium]|nr:sensor domain-containing diguanylate cyclase [Candidatus Omnitrophota bacterium]
MLLLRNLIFLIVVLYTFILNTLLFLNKVPSPNSFYFISLTVIISLFIVIELVYTISINKQFQILQRVKEKLELSVKDMKNESVLLEMLTDIIEAFEGEMSLEEVLNNIAESIKKIFKQESVILQLLGETFKKAIIGKPIEITDEILGNVVLKPSPMLINNTSSFPEYNNLAKQGITSFIIAPFHHKRKVIGMIGVFSFEKRVFTLKDLELLRMVSAPTSLLIENADLFEKTKLLSITDALTNIYNRRYFENIFETTVNEVRNSKQPLSVCMADIDHFKHYNDLNGHPAGDYALKKIAEIMRKNIKGSDIVARYGGEEFVIVFPYTTKENAVIVCETIRKKIKDFRFNNEESQPNGDLTISIGIASYPEDGETGQQLLKKADIALYKAKEQGRDCVVTA